MKLKFQCKIAVSNVNQLRCLIPKSTDRGTSAVLRESWVNDDNSTNNHLDLRFSDYHKIIVIVLSTCPAAMWYIAVYSSVRLIAILACHLFEVSFENYMPGGYNMQINSLIIFQQNLKFITIPFINSCERAWVDKVSLQACQSQLCVATNTLIRSLVIDDHKFSHLVPS